MPPNQFQAPDDATMRGIKAMGAPPSNRMPLQPAMAAPKAVQSFDLGGGAPWLNSRLSKPMTGGDRSLTANPGGMGGPQVSAMGDALGRRGMTPERRLEIAARRGDARANAALYDTQRIQGGVYGGRRYGPPHSSFAPQPPQPRPVPVGVAPSFAARPPEQEPQPPLSPPQVPQDPASMDFSLPPLPPPMTAPSGPAPLPWEQPQPRLDITQPLPPSTLMGGSGVPMGPAFSEHQVGGFNVLTGPDGKGGQKFLNAYTAPQPVPQMSNENLAQIRAAGFQQTRDPQGNPIWLPNGQPQLAPLPVPVPTERVTEGPTGTTRTYTQPRGAPPPAAEGGGGSYYDSLLPAAPTASTATGQMPNEAYAAPLTPEQMLAAAREEYLRTGNDAGIRQHFAEYPSDKNRLIMGALNPTNPGGQRVMTHEEALRSLQPAPLPVLAPQRPFWNTVGAAASDAARDVANFPRALADYGRQNPLLTIRR